MIPLSVLDLAMVPDGATSTDAFAQTTAVAQAAERLGYTRIWVAEHHNMATVASTTPAVLMAHLAANTETIKVGSGGVMLPNHAPLAIAEQFAMLEALYPGRVDLGVGRAPGTDGGTAMALRGARNDPSAEDFPRNLVDVMGLLGDVRNEQGLWNRFSATPVATSSPSVIPLGSSGFSAQLAGILGLPFGFRPPFRHGWHRRSRWYLSRLVPTVAGARRAVHHRDCVDYRCGDERPCEMAVWTGTAPSLWPSNWPYGSHAVA